MAIPRILGLTVAEYNAVCSVKKLGDLSFRLKKASVSSTKGPFLSILYLFAFRDQLEEGGGSFYLMCLTLML